MNRLVGRDPWGARGYLIHRRIGPLFPRPLRVGHDDDPFRQPVVWRLLAADGPLAAADAQLPLQLLDKSVLRVALVHDDGPHFAPQQPVPVHGVHVGGLLGAADDRLQLQKVDGQRVERREQEAGTATRWGLQETSGNFRGSKHSAALSVHKHSPLLVFCFLQPMWHELSGGVSVTGHAPQLKPKQ